MYQPYMKGMIIGMSEYHVQTVKVALKKDSPLFRRIQKYALKEGVGVEAVIDAAMSLSGDKGISDGLDHIKRLREL